MESKSLSILLIFIIIATSLFGCGGKTQVKDCEATITIGKVIARRIGAIAAHRYPVLASQVEPIATAILESAADGDDLMTILKKGLAEIPKLDSLTTRDLQDLLELVELHNVPEVYTEIAAAFIEGLAIYQNVK